MVPYGIVSRYRRPEAMPLQTPSADTFRKAVAKAPAVGIPGDSKTPQQLGQPFKAKNNRRFDPDRLRQRHHRVLELAAMGTHTQKQIADMTGYSPAHVCSIINSELGKIKLARLTQEAEGEVIDIALALRELTPAAVSAIEEDLFDEDSRTRIKTAFKLLEMTGFGATKKVDVTHRKADSNDISEIKARAEAARQDVEDAKVVAELEPAAEQPNHAPSSDESS